MSSQRSKQKSLLGGYVSKALKNRVRDYARARGMTETNFAEFIAIRELLVSGQISVDWIDRLDGENLINRLVMRELRETGLLEKGNGKHGKK